MKGIAAFESLAAAVPISSARASPAAPSRAAAQAPVDDGAARGDLAEGGGTKTVLRNTTAPVKVAMSRVRFDWAGAIVWLDFTLLLVFLLILLHLFGIVAHFLR